jgi:hypothetical protein
MVGVNVGGMKSVGLRCSYLSKYHNVCTGLKRLINHERPTGLYRGLVAVLYLKLIDYEIYGNQGKIYKRDFADYFKR